MSSGKKIVNPYNFIPFQESAVERIDKEGFYRGENQKKLHSGWLDVKVLTKTELIIPDGTHPEKCDVGDNKQHLKYKFMKMYNPETGKKECVIPGSELRGMIRSVYEIVTNSCFPKILDDKSNSFRVPLCAALNKRGLLGYDGKKWVLYDTTKRFEKVDGGSVKKRKEKPGDYVKGKGYVQYNVPVGKKYNIAYLEKGKSIYKWPEVEKADGAEAYKELMSALERDGVTGNIKNPNQKCNEALKDVLKKACENSNQLVPVYYFLVKDKGNPIVYMSGSACGRIAQRRKWEEILGDYAPCKQELCPACLLFGTAKGEGMKGHIRVSDAFLEEDTVYGKKEHILDILGEPKTSAFEFYLQKPEQNAIYWNYDFYGKNVEKKNKYGKNKRSVEYCQLKESLLRGRKMYWHHPISVDATNKNNLNQTMESITNGIFKFKVYFDQITEKQLRDLIWVLTLGENNTESKLQHKLGHAKPYGYGSVKLLVSGGCVRYFKKTENGELKIQTKNIDEIIKELKDVSKSIEPTFSKNNITINSLLNMCNVDALKGETVEYPQINGKVYSWFSSNRGRKGVLQTLPLPTNQELTVICSNGSKKEDRKDAT